MKKSIILGGLSLVLFAAGAIFFTSSIASNATANETIDKAVNNQKPAACQRLMTEGTCGCVANGGTCGCGQNGGQGCQAAKTSTDGEGTVKPAGATTCGCQKNVQ